MIEGTVLNVAAFISSNYLANYLSGNDGKAALAEKVRHNKAIEAYNAAKAKYTRDRITILDCTETKKREIKEQAKNFTNTDLLRVQTL